MGTRGAFICIEGLDGCGKTTQARLLVRRLRREYDILYTAEPSKGKIGRFIKKYYLHGNKRCSSTVEALLFAADRFEHVENEVLPVLRKGRNVISDRYVYSSLAYQGAAGLDLAWIKELNKHVLRPDLAIFIDVKPETVVRRLKPKKSVMEDLETQRKVREVYLSFVENGELVQINGNRSKKKVTESIAACIRSFMKKPKNL